MKLFGKKTATAAAESEDLGPLPGFDPGIRGQDLRRMGELKADRAGAKWRANAEASGDIARETGGPKGLEPTRYGDWERAGRCIDF